MTGQTLVGPGDRAFGSRTKGEKTLVGPGNRAFDSRTKGEKL